MGFRSGGFCYDTAGQALQHWLDQYPLQQGSSVYSVSGYAYSAPGQYLVSMQEAFANGGTTGNTFAVIFPDCTTSSVPITDLPHASLWLIAALAFAAFAGFRTGFRP